MLCAETLSAIDVARLSVTRALMLGAGDVLVMDNYRCGWQGILLLSNMCFETKQQLMDVAAHAHNNVVGFHSDTSAAWQLS